MKPPIILIENNVIDYVEEYKFLGFYFTSNLCLQTHINYIKKTTSQFINILKSLCGVSWGSDPDCLLLLYLGVVRTKIEYASICLLDCTKSQLIQLKRIQWKCLRIILGAMSSTHTDSLEVLSNVMPLDIRFSLLADKFINNCIAKEDHPITLLATTFNSNSNIALPKIIEKIKVKKATLTVHNQQIHNRFSYPLSTFLHKPYITYLNLNKIDTSNEVAKTKYLLAINRTKFKDAFRIFTDGSKTCDKVGAGFWMPDINMEAHFQLNPQASIFTAEARAMLEALNFVEDIPRRKFVIITDSMSVLQALDANKVTCQHPLIHDIKNAICQLKKKLKIIHFLWVPSHKGIRGNEIADPMTLK